MSRFRPGAAPSDTTGQLTLFPGLSVEQDDPTPPPAAMPPAPPPRPDATAPVPFTAPERLPEHLRWREVDTPQQRIGFLLRRSRRRSIGLSIQDSGLLITAPKWATLAQIDEAVATRASWILAKLRQQHARQADSALAQAQWRHEGRIPYLGVPVTLALADHLQTPAFDGDPDAPRATDRLQLPLPPHADDQRIRDSAHAWLQQQARRLFDQRLHHFLVRSGATLRGWRLSSANTRWGSCSSDGRIMLNWRLIHYDRHAIDYVIAHEVAHLREMHHGPAFWQEVARLMPDYATARERLRPHQPGTLPLL